MTATSGTVPAAGLEAARLRRIRWRARRGLLENDIVLERFLARRGDALTEAEVAALDQLLDLADPVLLDLILARSEPDGALASPAVAGLLAALRTA
ncbi:MAG: succinate dehydrogenase assembly factor 2 [Lautropia sp.]